MRLSPPSARANYLTFVEKIELLLDDILMSMGRSRVLRTLLLLCRLLLLLLDEASRGCSGSETGPRSGGAAGRLCPLHFAQPHGAGAQHPQFGG
jgi:hypothetical protein